MAQPAPSTAPPPRPFDSDFVLDMPSVGSPAIRPGDGAVAYVVSRVDRETLAGESHIERVPFGGGAARTLTSGPRDGSPRWSPDGSTLAFLRREEEGAPQIWLLPAEGGEAAPLTSLRGGVAEFAWSPGGATIYCTSDIDPDALPASAEREPPLPRVREVHEIYYRGDTIGWRGRTRRQIFAVAATGGRARRLTRGDFQHRALAVSPDGAWLAFASDRSRRRHEREPWGAELCVMPVGGGRVRRLARDVVAVGAIAWRPGRAPGEEQIAFVGAPENNTWQRYLYLLDLASDECRSLTDDSIDPQTGFFPIAPAPPLVWHGERVLFLADAAGASGVYAVTPSGEVEAVRARRELIGGLDATPDGERLAVVASNVTTTPQVRTLDLRNSRGRAVTRTGSDYLDAHPPGRTARFRVRRAGESIEARLVYPPDFDASRRYPLVLEIHGGPNAFHGDGFSPLHQVLAGAGFLVLAVNPRGSSSYGADFTAQVFEDWGGEDYLDLLAAVAAACRRPYVDEQRLGLHGYSYGGYMTSWIVGHSDRFRAAVIGAPVTNLVSMYGQTDIAVSFGERQWGGLPQDNFDHYVERSPLSYADRVTTPVLLLHGEDDIRVPISQSEEFYVALKRRGKTVEFARFPGCSHLFLRSGHASLRKEYYDRSVAWLQQWLTP